MPKRNLATESGIIAANFNIEEEEVVSLREKGFDTGEIVKILIISEGSYLGQGEILMMVEEGKSFEEIGKKAGIDTETLQQRSDKIEKNLAKYSR
ncbi:MAG: hypothetical protein JXJ19_09355 [Elusimicrobia bacterium]|nr:hypothetical protein [Elusimicrobiota bacterium]